MAIAADRHTAMTIACAEAVLRVRGWQRSGMASNASVRWKPWIRWKPRTGRGSLRCRSPLALRRQSSLADSTRRRDVAAGENTLTAAGSARQEPVGSAARGAARDCA